VDNGDKVMSQRLRDTLDEIQPWAEEYSSPIQDGYIKDPNQVEKYIKGSVTLYEASMDLDKLGLIEITRSLLAAKSGRMVDAKTHLFNGISNRLVFNALSIIGLKGTGRYTFVKPDDVLMEMMAAISMGGLRIARQLHTVLIQGLTENYGIKNGHVYKGQDVFRYSAMALTIIHDWLGLPLDLDKLGFPRDPAWGPLVSHWRDPDAEKLLPILNAACDVHVERIWRGEEGTESQYEFNSPFLAVYPAEILAVLRLRDSLGLANPVMDHPLMQTPYAQITALPGEITQKDALMDGFLHVARQRDPQILQQWDAAEYKG